MPNRRLLTLFFAVIVAAAACAAAHDVPDRSFDRSIQVTILADRIQINYGLGLTNLTLAEELLALVGPGGLAGSTATDRLETYAAKMGPLLADGLLLTLDGVQTTPKFLSSRFRVEDHPSFTFDLVYALEGHAGQHRIGIEDTNFFLEKGRVSIAINAAARCQLEHSSAPTEVAAVPPVASWDLTPEQQDAMRRATAVFRMDADLPPGLGSDKPASNAVLETRSVETQSTEPAHAATPRGGELIRLLDEWSKGVFVVLLGLAFFFGAAHAMTPGHGKTMVAAYLVGERGTMRHAVGLGLTTSLTHTSSVLVVALLLWIIGPAIEQKIHTGFALLSGILVAALGATLLVVRLSRQLRQRRATAVASTCSHAGCAGERSLGAGTEPSWGGLITLGISGGVVPCWDAVVLLLIAMAQGQLNRAVLLLLSFSAGLAGALVLVGILAVKMRGFLSGRLGSGRFVRLLPVFSAAAILAVGVYLCFSTLRSATMTATVDRTVVGRAGVN